MRRLSLLLLPLVSLTTPALAGDYYDYPDSGSRVVERERIIERRYVEPAPVYERRVYIEPRVVYHGVYDDGPYLRPFDRWSSRRIYYRHSDW